MGIAFFSTAFVGDAKFMRNGPILVEIIPASVRGRASVPSNGYNSTRMVGFWLTMLQKEKEELSGSMEGNKELVYKLILAINNHFPKDP